MATFGVTASVAHFISVEMIKGLLAVFRIWTSVAMLRIEAVVNVTVEVVRTVEPRAGSVDRDLRGCRAWNAGQSGEQNSEGKNL